MVRERQNEETDFQFLVALFESQSVRDDTGIRPTEESLELEAKGLERQPAQKHSQARVGKLQASNELQLERWRTDTELMDFQTSGVTKGPQQCRQPERSCKDPSLLGSLPAR